MLAAIMRVCVTTVCLFSGVIACVSDSPIVETVTTEAGTPTSEALTTGEAPTTGETGTGVTSSTGDTGTSDTGDTGEAGLEYAHGVRLTRVTATQAVQTDIVKDGAPVAGEDYAVRLISRRKTVLRANWSLHADFVPRELIGRLTIWTPEGETAVDDFKVLVDGESNDGDLFKTFSWQLTPEFVRPGLEYRVAAYEVDPAMASGEISDPPPILPLAGRGTLQVADDPMEIKVRLIPIKHLFEGDECMPEISDVDVEDMVEWMEMHNAVERAIIEVGEPLEYTKSIAEAQDGFVPVLDEVAIRRAADNPPDNLYYYALITSCDGYPPGLLGQAIAITEGSDPGFAYQRIASGRYLGSGAAARETFVHELGHAQGRYHVQCSGGEAGFDPSYPHSNGRIGLWGYGVHDTSLRSPTGYRDYMTYCGPAFVSDFGWELTYDYIKELTSWDYAGPPVDPDDGPLLRGTLYSDGGSRWWTTHGSVPSAAAGAELEFEAGGQVITAPAAVAQIPHGTARSVTVRLPHQWSAVTGLRLREDGEIRAAAPRSAVREHHVVDWNAGP